MPIDLKNNESVILKCLYESCGLARRHRATSLPDASGDPHFDGLVASLEFTQRFEGLLSLAVVHYKKNELGMLTERDQKFITYWQQKRSLGKWKYAFLNGVLQWAWPVFVLSEIFKYATHQQGYVFNASKLFLGFMIWTALGLLAWGTWMWRSNEKNYDRIKNENPEQ